MKARFVFSAGFGVGGSKCGVTCAADLFVEEGVLRVLLDAEVGADGELAEDSCAGVLIDHVEEEFFAFAGGGVDDFAGLEGEDDVVAFAAVVDGGEGVADGAFGGVFDGTGEDFAVGEIFVAVAVDPCAAVDGEAEVGVFGDDADFFFSIEIIDEALLGFGDFFPGGDGVGEVKESGAEDEILIVVERHFGILCGGVGGELGAGPAKLLFGGAFEKTFEEWLSGLRGEGLFSRIDVAHALGVFFRPETDGDIHFFDEEGIDGIDEGELLVGGGAEKDVVKGVGAEGDERIPAGVEDFFVDGFDEREAWKFAADANKVAFFYGGGIVDEDVGEDVEAGIAHEWLRSGGNFRNETGQFTLDDENYPQMNTNVDK